MNITWLPIAFGVVMASLDVVMMSMVKQVTTGALPLRVGLPLATLLYSLEPFVFWQSMVVTGEGMTVMNLVWDLTSDVIITVLGLVWFGEKIQGLRWLAVALSLTSLALFAYTAKD